jgi:hypothetical protein
MDNYLSSLISSVFKKQPKGAEPDSPDATPGRRSERAPARGVGGNNEQAGYDRADRVDMRQLIQSTRQ